MFIHGGPPEHPQDPSGTAPDRPRYPAPMMVLTPSTLVNVHTISAEHVRATCPSGSAPWYPLCGLNTARPLAGAKAC